MKQLSIDVEKKSVEMRIRERAEKGKLSERSLSYFVHRVIEPRFDRLFWRLFRPMKPVDIDVFGYEEWLKKVIGESLGVVVDDVYVDLSLGGSDEENKYGSFEIRFEAHIGDERNKFVCKAKVEPVKILEKRRGSKFAVWQGKFVIEEFAESEVRCLTEKEAEEEWLF